MNSEIHQIQTGSYVSVVGLAGFGDKCLSGDSVSDNSNNK